MVFLTIIPGCGSFRPLISSTGPAAAAAEAELRRLLTQLAAAKTPAEVFGPAPQFKSAYRRLAQRCHPDRCAGHDDLARRTFIALQRWRDLADAQLAAGTYGARGAHGSAAVGDAVGEVAGTTSATVEPSATVTLRHKGWVYEVGPGRPFVGDFCTVYRARARAAGEGGTPPAAGARRQVAVKVARTPADNDLLLAERTVLRHLWRDGTGVGTAFRPFLPELLGGFSYDDGTGAGRRAANVLSWAADAFTLAEIGERIPGGVHPKDVAWIYRRLLGALGAIHRAGAVHGGVLPHHVAVVPETHGLMLLGWTTAGLLEEEHRVPALGAACDSPWWYPQEVLRREPATPAADIFMAARCMLVLLGHGPAADSASRPPGAAGGRPLHGSKDAQLLAAFFRGCCLPSPRSRPKDAWALLREFDDLIGRLWGERRFHPFAVPGPCPR
jgi:hypothetical protein